MKKFISSIFILFGSICLFSAEQKPDETVFKSIKVYVNETITFKQKEDSTTDGYKWYVDTGILKTVKVKEVNHFQSNEDVIQLSFSQPGVDIALQFKYASIKDKTKVKHIIYQTFRVADNVHLEWIVNYKEAQEKARKENKYVMLFFTSSDGCGACKSLDTKVFCTKRFEKYAKKNLVLVEVDIPRKAPIKEGLQGQTTDLRRKFPIEGFPTCYFLNSDGVAVGNIKGYKDQEFIDLMVDILKRKETK